MSSLAAVGLSMVALSSDAQHILPALYIFCFSDFCSSALYIFFFSVVLIAVALALASC